RSRRRDERRAGRRRLDHGPGHHRRRPGADFGGGRVELDQHGVAPARHPDAHAGQGGRLADHGLDRFHDRARAGARPPRHGVRRRRPDRPGRARPPCRPARRRRDGPAQPGHPGGRHPGAGPPPAGRLPENLRPIAQANVAAGAELRAMTTPKTDLPPWRILTPPPADELERDYHEAEAATHVPWAYLAAVHLVETRMGRIRGTSTAGAQGPMQFLPSTWARWGGGGDINDPHDAIMAAGRYLAASGAPADLHKALYAYNHSEHYVRAVTLYAQQIEADPRAYLAYHEWQVYYITPRGDLWLEEGYGG